MKAWIQQFKKLANTPPENEEDFLPLEDDPVGALLEQQKEEAPADEEKITTAEVKPRGASGQQQQIVLPEHRERLVPKENDPLMALVKKQRN